MVEMAESIQDVVGDTGNALSDAWSSRAEIMEGVFDKHALNVDERIENLESRFEAVQNRLIVTFAALSTLRTELTELSADNAGPSETLAEVLSAASETLSAIS